MERKKDETIRSIEWKEDHLRIIDQTLLPSRTVYLEIEEVTQAFDAIREMQVRGAPAIGIVAAYGLYLAVRESEAATFDDLWNELTRASGYLAGSRPTAVNLQWALDRIRQKVYAHKASPVRELKGLILETARIIHEEDKEICRAIGLAGLELVPEKAGILTHCNTGGLATAQYGTALSVIYHAHLSGRNVHVWVGETRPRLQGARLTAWELQQAHIPMHLVTDSMAGHLMKSGRVDMVITGADRIAANGDTANKIGTYSLAVLARQHELPFYVAAPLSTFDMSRKSGEEIPIEERDADEVRKIDDHAIAPEGTPVFNPAFDVTPSTLVTAFITEKGIVRPDYSQTLATLFAGQDLSF